MYGSVATCDIKGFYCALGDIISVGTNLYLLHISSVDVESGAPWQLGGSSDSGEQ